MNTSENRRRFMTHFATAGLGATLLPGVLWGKMQEAEEARISAEMLRDALAMSGIEFSEEERTEMVERVNDAIENYEDLHNFHIPNDISPPFHFDPIVPGMKVDRTARPFRISDPPAVTRPSNLEDVAFWPVRHLAELVRTRQVSSVELTTMYMDRLKRHNPVLNCVVSFTDDLAMNQARAADAEIEAGRYKGPLHGIPWGAKDIIAAKGYRTTWGSGAYQEQVLDYDATVVMFRRVAVIGIESDQPTGVIQRRLGAV